MLSGGVSRRLINKRGIFISDVGRVPRWTASRLNGAKKRRKRVKEEKKKGKNADVVTEVRRRRRRRQLRRPGRARDATRDFRGVFRDFRVLLSAPNPLVRALFFSTCVSILEDLCIYTGWTASENAAVCQEEEERRKR